MKKIVCFILTAICLSLASGCKDSDFADLYVNPAGTSTVSCEKLMTGVFWSSRWHTMGELYWRYIFDKNHLGIYCQTVGYLNTADRYAGTRGYQQNRWNNFYETLTQYRVLQVTYNELPDADKPNNEVFELLSRAFVYNQLQEVVDIWGDVPYSEAGVLPTTGDLATAYPTYDDAVTVYNEMLDGMDEINTRLAALEGNLSTLTASLLPAQDYINKGDLGAWRRFVNSTRLRMALRVSTQGDLADKGKQIISAILADPGKYPLVETNDQNIKIDADDDAFKNDMGNPWGGVRGAFEDGTNIHAPANFLRVTKTMLDVLGVVGGEAGADPRLAVLVDPVDGGDADGKYQGFDPVASLDVQRTLLDAEPVQYSRPSTATFARNVNFPGIMFTAAETWFIKAEAYQRGYAAGDATAAFKQAVKLSTDYYYWLNGLSAYADPIPAPAAAELDAFAQGLWDKAANKEKVILENKWLHFALIQMREAWADLRRTGYPELTFTPDPESANVQKPPYRMMYPDNERDNNHDNWAAMESKDTYLTTLFWAKPGDYYSLVTSH